MKVCSKCNQERPFSFFQLSDSGNYRNQCRDCRRKAGTDRKKARREMDKKIALLEAASKQLPDNVALPRTFHRVEAWVPEDRSYYRNNGNKHIQSRGV